MTFDKAIIIWVYLEFNRSNYKKAFSSVVSSYRFKPYRINLIIKSSLKLITSPISVSDDLHNPVESKIAVFWHRFDSHVVYFHYGLVKRHFCFGWIFYFKRVTTVFALCSSGEKIFYLFYIYTYIHPCIELCVQIILRHWPFNKSTCEKIWRRLYRME